MLACVVAANNVNNRNMTTPQKVAISSSQNTPCANKLTKNLTEIQIKDNTKKHLRTTSQQNIDRKTT